MTPFTFEFHSTPSSKETLQSKLILESPNLNQETSTRIGKILIEKKEIEITLYSNSATQRFMYLRDTLLTPTLAQLTGMTKTAKSIKLPGQLILGGERSQCLNEAMTGIFGTIEMKNLINTFEQTEIALLPILREGVKYNLAEALFSNHSFYSDEVVVDAHHVSDSSVDGYGRRVDITMFKDVDMTEDERKKIKLVIVGDSIAGGVVIIGMLKKLQERFPNLERVEVIAPLTTLFGASRIAMNIPEGLIVRIHMFETILNAQPPDFYWSPHYSDLNFHINPQLETEYREWWGQDQKGKWIADTACAGYGWSEAFFHPQKFIRMMNVELKTRHHLEIKDIIQHQN